jgi:hypothetical protein
VLLERIVDPVAEGLDDGLADRLEAVLEVEGAETRLDQSGENVAVLGEPLELFLVDLTRVFGEEPAEPEARADDRAALPRDDVRADLRELSLRVLRKPLVELLRDRKPQNAVPEELEALVGVGPGGRPGSVRESVLQAFAGERLDQLEQRSSTFPAAFTGVSRCSRRPARRSGSAERPRPRS